MNYQQLQRILAKLGAGTLPQPNTAGWLHISCMFAQWKHKSGVDRSKGMAIKVEEKGISAYTCPACKQQGRISGLARALAHFRHKDYDEIAAEADQYDMLGTELVPFDEQFSPDEQMPDPLDERIFAGLFDPVAKHREAIAFVQKRQISRGTCEKLKIEFDPEKRRIVFPVRNGRNELFGWSGRTVIPDHEPKVLDYAGLPKRALILGQERWRPSFPKLMVEGLVAYARMHEIGAEDFVDIGALLGSTLTEEKAAILMAHGCTVIAMPDPDKAGAMCLYGRWKDFEPREIEARERKGLPYETGEFVGGGLIDQLAGEIPVRVPFYPQGVEDIDDITLEDLKRVIASAPMAYPKPAGLDKKSRTR